VIDAIREEHSVIADWLEACEKHSMRAGSLRIEREKER
jgi:hypothetical protein